jgi:uncharacterized protein (TIGR02145 family)
MGGRLDWQNQVNAMKVPISRVIIICLTVIISLSCKKDNDITGPNSEKACSGIPKITYAGKTYSTVQIGNQCWLNENLDVGIMIGGYANPADNDTIEKYCYNNDSANCYTYGGLYQWNEAMQYSTVSGAGGICPSGWHIPTFKEFQTLSENINGDANGLKAIGEGQQKGAGTNESGFKALLSGFRDNAGFFAQNNSFGFFWSSTNYDQLHSRYLQLDATTSVISLYGIFNKCYGFSIRCIKD